MRIKKFFEANLSLGALDKPSKSGGKRGDVLLKKLRDGEKMTVKTDNKTFNTTIVNAQDIIPFLSDETGKYDSEKAGYFLTQGQSDEFIPRYKKVFQSDRGELLQLNNFEKTEDFGSSGGSSLGTQDTRIVESIQCLFLALRQHKRKSLVEESIYELFDDRRNIRPYLMSNIRVPIDLNYELIHDFSEDWINTFISTANALYETRPSYTSGRQFYEQVLDIHTTYVFYHHSFRGGFTELLTTCYRSYSETKGIPITKWTPSDIWAVAKSIDQNPNIFEGCEDINSFNEKVNFLFYDGRTKKKLVRGISLKKLKTIKSETDIELVINKLTPKPVYKFNSIRTSYQPLTSLGVNLIVTQYSEIESQNNILQIMKLRSYAGPNETSDIQGEVMGFSARHGKIGLERMNHIFETCNNKFNTQIPKIETKEELLQFSDEELLERIRQMNDMIIQKAETYSQSKKEESSFRVRLISKFQSLRFGILLYELSKSFVNDNGRKLNLADKIVNDIFYYAMSIENDRFVCPMYVRII